ncbi:MAG: MOSC domain-containing protein [Nitrospira sp.]|nr:MOSC domain-containing protein [Nitrospira sp.]
MKQSAIPHLHQISLSDGGVPKRAVPSAVITIDGLAGDRQRNRKYHGGPDRAVCLYSLEIIEALRAEGHSIGPGSSGENLTVAGLDWRHMAPGDRLTIGEHVRLELSSYTAPCRLNAQWFRDGDFRRIAQEAYPGWSRLYARVLNEGAVKPGDAVVVEACSGER